MVANLELDSTHLLMLKYTYYRHAFRPSRHGWRVCQPYKVLKLMCRFDTGVPLHTPGSGLRRVGLCFKSLYSHHILPWIYPRCP